MMGSRIFFGCVTFGLEEGVLVADGDELPVALASLVRHARQVGVSLLAVAAHHFAVVKLVLPADKQSP